MQSTAKLRYLRIAPRKVRLVADKIRGKKVSEAQLILRFAIKSSAEPVRKTLNSAVASAKNNFELDEANLYIAKISVDEGPKLKRFRPRARGRAYPIEKKTSHITVTLDEITPGQDASHKQKETKTETSETMPLERKGKINPKNRVRFRPEREKTRTQTEAGARKFFRRKAI